MSNVEIKGIATAFPEELGKWVSNEDIYNLKYGADWKTKLLDIGIDKNYIEDKWGFSKRFWVHTPGHVLTENEATSVDMMYHAIKNALHDAELLPEDIDLLISVTTTSPRYTSSTATYVGGQLGMKCASFEMKTGCASNLYAMTLGFLSLQSGLKNVLIVSAETFSKIADFNTNQVFAGGDAAAAVVLSRVEKNGSKLLLSYLDSDGHYASMYGVQGALPPTEKAIKNNEYLMLMAPKATAYMNQIWEWLPDKLYRHANIKPEDVDCFIPHQSTKKTVLLATEKANIPTEKVVNVVSEYANCGAVSSLLALHKAIKSETIKKDDLLMMSVVGGGISWGGLLIRV
ncbi:MAG: hypothetical protein HKN92_02165 [Chitinophagales bacterium]|nr:hypothetical protein [Chitinophagales bacterium]